MTFPIFLEFHRKFRTFSILWNCTFDTAGPVGHSSKPQNLQKSVVANRPWFATAIAAFPRIGNGLELMRALSPFLSFLNLSHLKKGIFYSFVC
jgi:hypothetical protein